MPYLLYAIALICLSQSSIIIKWSAADPLLLGAWRLLFAGMILYLVSLKSTGAKGISVSHQKKIIAAGFAFFVHLFTYAYSAQHTSISHLMMLFSINPLTTALGSWLFFKEKFTRRQGAAYIIALMGIYLLAREKQGTSEIIGDVIALVAALTFSIYALLSQRVRHDLPNTLFASRLYLFGSLFFFIATWIIGTDPFPIETQSWKGIALLTLFPTLLGHGIFTYSMKKIPLYVLSLGKLIEPALAAISAFVLFGESLSPSSLISFVMIIAAVSLVVVKPSKEKNQNI